MLSFYLAQGDRERPWRLVIAGDLVDFIGISLTPAPELAHDLTDEERRHGLGSTPEQAVAKMRAVVRRHPRVFDGLAAFLEHGHSIVVVRGNHDVDFHWELVQQAFVDALLTRIPGLAEDAERRAAVGRRVEFHPWFYYEEGLLYVEHGHQFDAMCSQHHLLCPVSPLDRRRISWSFSDILLREVVQPTPGFGSEGHEVRGMFDYGRLALGLGLGGAVALARRFAGALARALSRWRAHLGEKAHALKEEHDRAMEELALRTRLGRDRVRALAALWPAPITRGALAVLRSMFIDRIVLGVLLVLVLTPLLIVLPLVWSLPLSGVLFALAAAFVVASGRLRVREVDPTGMMIRGARRIAALVNARFVVMGHTHEPLIEAVDERATYVNLGTWAVNELESNSKDAPRTHLVLRWVDGELRAQFLEWVPEHGPEPRAA